MASSEQSHTGGLESFPTFQEVYSPPPASPTSINLPESYTPPLSPSQFDVEFNRMYAGARKDFDSPHRSSPTSKSPIPSPLNKEMEGTSAHQTLDRTIKPSIETTESEDVVMSDSEVANFRGALHDEESPALDADEQVVRKKSKMNLSTYFSNRSLPTISPPIYITTRKGSYGMNAKSPDSEEVSQSHGTIPATSMAPPTSANSMRPPSSSWTMKSFKPGGSVGRLSSLTETGRTSLDKRAADVNAFLHDDTQEQSIPTATVSLRGGKGSSPEPELPELPDIVAEPTNETNIANSEDVKVERKVPQTPVAPMGHASGADKHHLDTPLPPSAYTPTSPTSPADFPDPLPLNASLPSFSVTDLRSRVATSDAALDDEWTTAKNRQKELLAMLSIWSEVAQQREKERVEKRLETRIKKCAMEEEALSDKERHRDQVVDAFKNVLGMLDNDGDTADEGDEEMGEWDDPEPGGADGGQKKADTQKLEENEMDF